MHIEIIYSVNFGISLTKLHSNNSKITNEIDCRSVGILLIWLAKKGFFIRNSMQTSQTRIVIEKYEKNDHESKAGRRSVMEAWDNCIRVGQKIRNNCTTIIISDAAKISVKIIKRTNPTSEIWFPSDNILILSRKFTLSKNNNHNKFRFVSFNKL